MLSAQLPASLPSSASAFSAVRVGPSGRPVRHRGPSRQRVGPVFGGLRLLLGEVVVWSETSTDDEAHSRNEARTRVAVQGSPMNPLYEAHV